MRLITREYGTLFLLIYSWFQFKKGEIAAGLTCTQSLLSLIVCFYPMHEILDSMQDVNLPTPTGRLSVKYNERRVITIRVLTSSPDRVFFNSSNSKKFWYKEPELTRYLQMSLLPSVKIIRTFKM